VGNVATEDGNLAKHTGTGDTTELKVSNFGFSIPSGATIKGIEITANGARAEGNNEARDLTAYAQISGANVGSNKATSQQVDNDSVSGWSGLYGGKHDLWGTTWTPAQINASSFGFAITFTRIDVGSFWVGVDYIQIKIYYTP
jgi:hypothetical protein